MNDDNRMIMIMKDELYRNGIDASDMTKEEIAKAYEIIIKGANNGR